MNVRLFLGLAVLGSCCSLSTVAKADTIFDLKATLTGVGNIGDATLTGTVGLNMVAGALTGFNVTFTNGGALAYDTTYMLNQYFGGPTTGTPCTEIGFYGVTNSYQASLFLYLPASAPLVGYTGGSICSTSFLCSAQYSGVSLSGFMTPVNASYTVDSGTLTAETPEPSGLVMVGTGLIAVAGSGRTKTVCSPKEEQGLTA